MELQFGLGAVDFWTPTGLCFGLRIIGSETVVYECIHFGAV